MPTSQDMRKFYMVFIFLTSLTVSCQEVEETPGDLGFDYQPLALGKFWVYSVTETVYFGESDAETSHYYYKDQIQSDYFNEEGEQVFLFVREKSTDRQTWLPEQTYTMKISKGSLIRFQDNRYLVALVFPPSATKKWNGNVLNMDQEEEFRFQMLTQYQLEDSLYNDVVKVVQQEEDDRIILRDNRYEVYAREVGLLESYYEVLNYCARNDCLGQEIIESGRFSHLKLIQYG